MAGLQVQGAGGSIAEIGAFAAKGLHHIAKPQDHGALGHYQTILTTGTIGAGLAANGELVQMRWTEASNVCLIQEIELLEFRDVAAAFAVGPWNFQAIRATAFTVDGTGGAVIAQTDPQSQLRTAMGNALLAIRLASTAALTAGTKTLDTLPIGAAFGNVGSTPAIAQMYVPAGSPVTGYGGPGVNLFKADVSSGEHPIVLATNDGLIIRANVPATGTFVASFKVKWAELAAF